MRYIIYLILLIGFTINNTSASPIIGKVIILKGEVTGLYLGSKEAIKITKGMSIREDTSLLSKEKSFAKILLNDGTTLTLGPQSKIVVRKLKKAKTNIISLLNGKMRSSVIKKQNNTDVKLIIKTKSAALAVRGTDFQATFNSDSKMTSLLTYEGNVSIVKIKNENTGINVEKNELDLFKKNTTQVGPGTYSSVSKNLDVATKPVSINPVQFSILKLNDNFLKKTSEISKTALKEEQSRIKKILAKKASSKEEIPDATYDAKTGIYKPKNGGYIDTNTGFYIPPSKDSIYNKKYNIFIDKDYSHKIKKDGNFNTPKGMILDAQKGFVAVSSQAKQEVKNLNQAIAGQIIAPRKPTLEEMENSESKDTYDKYFKMD